MSKISDLVTKGVALYKHLTEVQADLKAVEEELKKAAMDRSHDHQPLSDDEREGRRFIARTGGPEDLAVPVVFTADKLISSFEPDSEEHHRIFAAMGPDKLSIFFKEKTVFARTVKDGKAFRKKVKEHFGSGADQVIVAARELDDAGLPKSDIKVEWKEAATETEILAGPRKKARKGKAVTA